MRRGMESRKGGSMKKLLLGLTVLFSVSAQAYFPCMKFLMDKGYGPDYAKQVCTGFSFCDFECFQMMVGKGYGPDYAKGVCLGLQHDEVECLYYMMGKAMALIIRSKSAGASITSPASVSSI
jgi:hypothetical protein